jgi:uncharacterized membrane-anchored protein
MTSRRTILLAALVALLQIGFLGWMINGRATVIRDGREVLLRVMPVDPRDLLRGDYVRLGYEASDVPRSLIVNAPSDLSQAFGRALYVRLAPQADGYWMPVSASLDAPLDDTPGDMIDLRGILTGNGFISGVADVGRVDYGIERFYVPEGEGLAIQNDMRVRPFGILAAVDSDGVAQIKALLDGDKTLYEVPVF